MTPEASETKPKSVPTRFKRLPKNSHTIILKFGTKKKRDECINSEDFKDVFGEIARLLINYNSSIEVVKWDIISGQKKAEKG